MHHIYHTEGLILGSRNFGEADKQYYIFTRDVGMIHASAQGVRKMSSKLRFILTDYSYVKLDLVQGKNGFRVTSASKTNQLERIAKEAETFKIFSNIARLLRRLLAGVEPNEKLFSDLIRGLAALEKAHHEEDLQNIEALIVLRMLNNLGYIGENDALQALTRSPFEEEMILGAAKSRRDILRHINRALKETQL